MLSLVDRDGDLREDDCAEKQRDRPASSAVYPRSNLAVMCHRWFGKHRNAMWSPYSLGEMAARPETVTSMSIQRMTELGSALFPWSAHRSRKTGSVRETSSRISEAMIKGAPCSS